MTNVRYVAIGDSFTEGVGDELNNGYTRGWADLAAAGWATSAGEPIEYANLAIRGRLIDRIVEEQLEPALSLAPTHLSFNGGGNDMLRPRTNIARISAVYEHLIRRCREEHVTLILHAGANPSDQMPFGRTVQHKGDELIAAVSRVLREDDSVAFVNNWDDAPLKRAAYWSDDRLHMNTRGHHRVAARMLETLGVPYPESWLNLPMRSGTRTTGWRYYRQFVGPWFGRRLTGRSSGDLRQPKHPDWVTISPDSMS